MLVQFWGAAWVWVKVTELRQYTDKPICVGFGVSKGEHAAQLEQWGADGAIAGSALVKALGEAPTPGENKSQMLSVQDGAEQAMTTHLMDGGRNECLARQDSCLADRTDDVGTLLGTLGRGEISITYACKFIQDGCDTGSM